MAVKIRMKKMGSKKRPFYRIVAADSRSPRDGRFIEMLGYYNPMSDPPDIKFDDDKVFKWLDNGAKPTQNTAQLLRKAGLLERWQLLKSGVKISELDSKIEERRKKQPKPLPESEKKHAEKEEEAVNESPVEQEQAVEEPREVEPESGAESENKSSEEEQKK
ncbi:MAG: 30S ribosomal protein S16 [Candidatus Krumholzibacteria bacterium]|nr:30S ribosomal protein S16 [Candidatus Krumholzibacteria bacterium]